MRTHHRFQLRIGSDADAPLRAVLQSLPSGAATELVRTTLHELVSAGLLTSAGLDARVRHLCLQAKLQELEARPVSGTTALRAPVRADAPAPHPAAASTAGSAGPPSPAGQVPPLRQVTSEERPVAPGAAADVQPGCEPVVARGQDTPSTQQRRPPAGFAKTLALMSADASSGPGAAVTASPG
jgi:hypothetical protein